MKANQAAHSIPTMCRVLGVSASGYYAWQRRSASARTVKDQELLDQIRTLHRQSHGTYGTPRIHRDLRAAGVRVGRKRVARLLKQAGLRGVSRRKWLVTPGLGRITRWGCPAKNLAGCAQPAVLRGGASRKGVSRREPGNEERGGRFPAPGSCLVRRRKPSPRHSPKGRGRRIIG